MRFQAQQTKHRAITAALTMGLLMALPEAQAATTYTVTDLGAMLPGAQSVATVINNAGQIAGYTWTPDGQAPQYQTILWHDGIASAMSPAGSTQDGGAPSPYGINNQGLIVGTVVQGTRMYAATWSEDGQQQNHILPGTSECNWCVSQATAVNDHGLVVGWSVEYGPVAWQNGAMQQLAKPNVAARGRAMGINNAGTIVGSTDFQAAIWQGEQLTLLDSAGFRQAEAYDINEAGDIVGHALNSSMDTRSMLWRNGAAIELGSLTATDATYAEDINNAGQIVGTSVLTPSDVNSERRAVMWNKGTTTPVALDTLIDALDPLHGLVKLTYSGGINDDGVIAASGLIGGVMHAFKLTPVSPVPELASWQYLLAGGCLTMAASARRRRKARR